ncbi:DUF3180 domain-containing protein [Streptomonospora salina]|uniref:DUF3180 domain-containing protein n=1 Tax=Streptomonospora salina TaxID=104205 RepID=A0A841E6D3_9ACTN|nr:DUF3180 domain-containing protein [Streptomonospora salina]MBB5998014.1 hypothetical protein [Streptomonospora salina]
MYDDNEDRPEDDPVGDGEGRLKPTDWRVPAAVAAVAGVLCYVVIDRVYGSLPMLPWSAIPTLLLLAAAETIAAVHTRRRIRRDPGTVPMEPLSAARLLALAKASVVFAALAAGGFAGMLAALAERFNAVDVRTDALTAGGTLLSAVVLLAAALFLEYSCRVPGDDDPNGSRA